MGRFNRAAVNKLLSGGDAEQITHTTTHTNSCYGNNGSSSLNKAASRQQGLLVSFFLNYKPLQVKGAICRFFGRHF